MTDWVAGYKSYAARPWSEQNVPWLCERADKAVEQLEAALAEARAEVERLNDICDRLAAAGMSTPPAEEERD